MGGSREEGGGENGVGKPPQIGNQADNNSLPAGLGCGGRFAYEFQSPESRRWGQKLNTHSLAPITGIPQENHSAFLLFQSFRVGQHQHFPVVNFMLQEQQPAVGVDHYGLAIFAKLATVMAASFGLHLHLVEHPAAAAR